MKKIIIKLIVVSFFVVVCFSSCEKHEELKCDCFYYNFDEKICLQQDKNKIFIKFAPDADVEQLRNIINIDKSLQSEPIYWEEAHLWKINGLEIVLEKNRNKNISSATIESFKKYSEVVSVEYLLYEGYKGDPLGITDEFIVKLNATTSDDELQELLEKYNCKIVRASQFVENKFVISVSKNSSLNSMQMSNLFYETSLFEYTCPNFILINPFHKIIKQ